VNGDRTTVVGILGDDPLTSRIVALLLEDAGYEARVLEEGVSEVPSASAVEGHTHQQVYPLERRREEELLGAMGGRQGAAVPVVRLSTDPEAQRTESVLPWPWSTEALVGAIERALGTHSAGEAP
jgi:hypothetical protein